MGFCRPEDAIGVAEAVVTVQRDWGDRANRKHARLKYTIEDRGLGAVPGRGRAADRQGARGSATFPFRFERRPLRLDARRGRAFPPDALHRERTPARHPGRALAPDGLRRIAEVHDGEFRLTANQNVIIANVRPDNRAAIDELVAAHGLDRQRDGSAPQRHGLRRAADLRSRACRKRTLPAGPRDRARGPLAPMGSPRTRSRSA